MCVNVIIPIHTVCSATISHLFSPGIESPLPFPHITLCNIWHYKSRWTPRGIHGFIWKREWVFQRLQDRFSQTDFCLQLLVLENETLPWPKYLQKEEENCLFFPCVLHVLTKYRWQKKQKHNQWKCQISSHFSAVGQIGLKCERSKLVQSYVLKVFFFFLRQTKQTLTIKYCAVQLWCLDLVQWRTE